MGDGTFADVSSATGLDLMDDGRAVALVDWDFDGAIDLWVANRTAPRVRLLRNPNVSGNHWLAVKLRGTQCNRDAIGARLELHVAGESSPGSIKTLHAGDGYLSQSTKWVHFGLGTEAAIDHLDVIWPGGKRERFDDLTVDRHYQLIEGNDRADVWMPPQGKETLSSRPIEMPPQNSYTRTLIMGRVPLPADAFLDASGRSMSLADERGQPVLINLWSSTCAPCVQELTQWSGDDLLKSSGSVKVLALCVDSVDGDAKSAAQAEAFLRKLGVEFQSGLPTTELLDAMEVVQRTFLELQQPLPVPCSYLLDSAGRVAAIYKGRVSAEQIKQDLSLLDRPRLEQRDAAVPFAGRWASELFPFNPIPIMRTLELAGQPDAALSYLRDYLQLVQEELPEQARSTEDHADMIIDCYRKLGERLLVDGRRQEAFQAFDKLRQLAQKQHLLHRQVGGLLLARGHARQALSHYNLALEETPDDPQLRYHMGLAELSVRNVPAAIEHLRASVAQQPNDVAAHFHLANALHRMGDSAEAVKHYRLALEAQPDSPIVSNNLAWILATDRDPVIRDGADAVRLAEACCQATGFRDASTLATLAAAYAEAGDFEKATETNDRAIELLENSNAKPTDLDSLKQRQTLFESRQPFRQ